METNPIHENVPGGVPLKMWTRGVPVEDAAKRQLQNAARLPIVFKHIAAMPDVHFGIGATVGSVIPTVRAIIPAAVGVDIGCGMMACKTTLTAQDLPDNLGPLRSAIERAVPHGRRPGGHDPGAWQKAPGSVNSAWAQLEPEFSELCRMKFIGAMRALLHGCAARHMPGTSALRGSRTRPACDKNRTISRKTPPAACR